MTEIHNAVDDNFMKRAIELSYHAIEHGHGNPFGSVVVKDGVIVGEGWNQDDHRQKVPSS